MAAGSDIRIAKNTVIIYIRMAVTIVVGLITSRLVLQALGASEVGLFNAAKSAEKPSPSSAASFAKRDSPLNKPHGLQTLANKHKGAPSGG